MIFFLCIFVHLRFSRRFIFIIFKNQLSLCTCTCEYVHLCTEMPVKSKRGRQIPWSWCYRCLWTYWQDRTWVFSIRAMCTLNCPTISVAPTLRFYTQIHFLSVVYHQKDFNFLNCVLDAFAKTRKCQASYLLTAFLSSVRCHDVASQPAFTGVCSLGKTTLSPPAVVSVEQSIQECLC